MPDHGTETDAAWCSRASIFCFGSELTAVENIRELAERFIKNVTPFCHCEERQRRSNLIAISRYWRLLRYARNDLVLVLYLSMFS